MVSITCVSCSRSDLKKDKNFKENAVYPQKRIKWTEINVATFFQGFIIVAVVILRLINDYSSLKLSSLICLFVLANERFRAILVASPHDIK